MISSRKLFHHQITTAGTLKTILWSPNTLAAKMYFGRETRNTNTFGRQRLWSTNLLGSLCVHVLPLLPCKGVRTPILCEAKTEHSLLKGEAVSPGLLPGTDHRQRGSGNGCFLHAFLGSFAARPGQRISRRCLPWHWSVPGWNTAVFPTKQWGGQCPFCDLSRRGRSRGSFD